ncbi:hypothetical protein HYDPIDRAFT_177110 [Hydnomerulius pinastri MD-312]|uniref:Uncharacterized protein n=1 Tax=Hydnomerulius pinastri MD-312 TaxID=994086 RepID=A0A0C9WBX8_9AGAM|nr:hypothetical protein HYDPIDRAFT_177110 [Hydnomerulius pinastri MD-312]
MHRRVAQTVAAVLPQTYAWGSPRQWDPARLADEGISGRHDYGSEIAGAGSGRRRTSDSDYDTDAHDFSSGGPQQWRRMDSRGESILSGLDGEEEHDRMRHSPESMRRGSSLGRVAEEEAVNAEAVGLIETTIQQPEDPEDDIEWELEANGLYSGSYRRLVSLHSFVPLTALLTFVILAFLPPLVWPTSSSSSRYPPFFPSPLPEVLLSSAMFSLGHQLRIPLYSFSSLLLRPDIASLLSTFLSVLVINVLRLASVALLQVRHNMDYPTPTWQDPSFHTIWWFSLNVAEVLVAVVQGYQQIALYRDVMVPQGREHEFLERLKQLATPLRENNGTPYAWREPDERTLEESHEDLREVEDPSLAESRRNAAALSSQIDRDFDKLLAVKTREELEEVYGVAVIKIPVFISCLQRFNSIVLSLGLTLLLSSSYLRSPLSIPASDSTIIPYPVASHSPFSITFPIVLIIHTSLSSLYTPAILPRIGVHTAAYVGVLVSLMCLFAGLAVWGALS